MTPDLLARAMGIKPDKAAKWAPILAAAMAEYDISTPERQAAFLAQIGHESGGLLYLTELWGPTEAQQRYEGRADLGNTQPGDGARYKGRGLIQITGRANYKQAGEALGVDLITAPALLAEPALAARSAAWFWASRGLNALADANNHRRITQRINGGYNGSQDRMARLARAQAAMGIKNA